MASLACCDCRRLHFYVVVSPSGTPVFLPSPFHCVSFSSQDIFMFITRQLKGLEDTKSAQFNRYFYLLEVRDLCELISAGGLCRVQGEFKV